ncbi:hypothetical protein HYALB_00005269 [Hymenoscyphus albidus]|uniref:Anaphase-promoting complex subunit 1 n=1 Tax=Hymenoscyphus albidus TaxID=595503 RepID=A0A9N9LG86_9HELO|nr:hypothetical protein HYALB_00005269 [Hymenoscyphus albidus]
MASVLSLGLDQPTGLQYAIQEHLLPPDPENTDYKWHSYCNGDPDSTYDEDELLVTPRCVIWSRGGVFRKCYKFDLEKEPITQALLTSFPSVGPLVKNGTKEVEKNKGDAKREAAIVVFLVTQAHVYFLSGTSHVIHLPFEVECAIAAPCGIIIQRKLRVDHLAAASLKFPKVPPNSFISSQPPPLSASNSQQSTFSIADLGAPKQISLQFNTTLKDFWDPPALKSDTSWPRLFSLTDPLSELGLLVAQPSKADMKHRRRSMRISALNTAEEILHISRRGEFDKPSDQSLVLALTLNRETGMYTVWKMAYMGEASLSEKQRVASDPSRRRSSFMPGTATGATTPVMNSQATFGRESFAGVQPVKNGKKQEGAKEKVVDFVATLDPDFEGGIIPRRKSRRVSSMLARADLSANHERPAFTEKSAQHGVGRRGESLGSQHTRTSIGGYAGGNGPSFSQPPQFNQNLNSFLEAPVDDLLDELRAGGDFEGFHSMGLDDEEFDALRQEVMLTKVCSVPVEHKNIRYSSQQLPATSQCKVFTLTAPMSATDDQQGSAIVICVLDPDEQKLLVLTLYRKIHSSVNHDGPIRGRKAKDINILSLASSMRADDVIDACRLDDGHVSRIMVLSSTPDGYGEISLQAPWSNLTKIPLPTKFASSNTRSLGHNATPHARREGGFKRVLSQGPRALRGIRNSKPRGVVDLLDDEGKMHQLQVRLEPRNPHVCKILEVCRAVVPGPSGGEGVLVGWWTVMQWIRLESIETVDAEWTALVITLFSLSLGLNNEPKARRRKTNPKKKPRPHMRSSSGAQTDSVSWETMISQETANGNPLPSWANNPAWSWLSEPEDYSSSGVGILDPILASNPQDEGQFLQRHLKLAREFINSSFGETTVHGTLPTTGERDPKSRKAALVDTVIGLHLFREEQKLDIMTADAFTTGATSLTPVLAQIVRWLKWPTWVARYEVEEAQLLDMVYDTESSIESPINEPLECPSVYDWIQSCFTSGARTEFMTMPLLIRTRTQALARRAPSLDQWMRLTPRTLLFDKLFSLMLPNWSAVQFVEALFAVGVDILLLGTLPEAILIPLKEALAQCQPEPPTTWSKELLAMTGREDVKMLLNPGQRPRVTQSSLLVPTHESNIDVHTICISTLDAESTRPFDGAAEMDRQTITRAMFKDDRRMNEAMSILNTSRPTVARCKSEPHWSESELLEAQKEHAQMLAYRTLAIPAGRGLMYFSARVPLLTERLMIGGFNLSCVMKPDNNTVGVEKSAYTEEKVCWAFFHAGVAAGLSISRDAKGIDTSWILFNKPVQDLSNRHAGFLLALGLNGHLKSVAKWVAFKYLTPKHTMTSIGLLLGLAASYMGTMDSLITRLLSVHVTRMLPPGAAELNLSTLTQTTGIMGIGLLYCNTQHRRMSEIMVSEIEHIDTETEEEPLRNEGYRLAAGFALGFINLGKGSDLQGLHDMRLTERLLTLAAGAKKVDLVHVLDKATAAAVMAIALIFMKSENQVLARKIDVPDSLLQFDYVRPDIFLLRTLAKNLILWSKIEPSFAWIKSSLPTTYRYRATLENVKVLTSDDLPFYDIVTGLCFSIALRYAGSGSTPVRDLLIHYLDQLIRICRIEAETYDQKLTRNTVRKCQDLLALGLATIMAGSGDLEVFRRLRSLHGRDDSATTYGSHLASHLAIGALFLGGGTFTFGTSNMAIAALLVAFYPIFPSSVQDNKSHLQAFRHFWALAAEPRCLITRDIDTNQPVPVPVTITLRDGSQTKGHTPGLLPEYENMQSIRTDSSEYWNVVLDLQSNSQHLQSLKSNQTIHVRKRQPHDSNTSVFNATLQTLNDSSTSSSATISKSSPVNSLEWIFDLDAFKTFTKAERALVLPVGDSGTGGGVGSVSVVSDMMRGTRGTVVDSRLLLEGAMNSGKRDRVVGLRFLFEWMDGRIKEGGEVGWVRREVVERLKSSVWVLIEGRR